MNPATMRHRVTIEERPDEDGWSDSANAEPVSSRAAMAAIEPLDGAEYIAGQQSNSRTTHKITTHYFGGANARMRILCGGRVFNVESVINLGEMNRFLQWRCEELG
jgi:SPP1 family predicted phage head-tail adaptor